MSITVNAEQRLEVHIPLGVSVWTTSLLRDRDCDCGRLAVAIKATAESEAQARDLLRLALERLIAGLAGDERKEAEGGA